MDKKSLINIIKDLDCIHHIELFHILNRHNVKYSQNTNGIFIDMNEIDDILLQEFENYVSFAQNHPSTIDKNKIIIKEEINEINNYDENDIDNKTSSYNQTNLEISKDTIIEKDIKSKQSKKNENKFIAAKKKYSKQILTETKDI